MLKILQEKTKMNQESNSILPQKQIKDETQKMEIIVEYLLKLIETEVKDTSQCFIVEENLIRAIFVKIILDYDLTIDEYNKLKYEACSQIESTEGIKVKYCTVGHYNVPVFDCDWSVDCRIKDN